MSKLTYKSMHWGTGPQRVTTMRYLADQPARALGELAACSYATVKAGKPDVFRHPFSKHPDGSGNKRGPLLLAPKSDGSFRMGPGDPEMIAVGQAIDLEFADGSRWALADCWYATDADGSTLWVVSPGQVLVQIEQREAGPFVTNHGIEQ